MPKTQLLVTFLFGVMFVSSSAGCMTRQPSNVELGNAAIVCGPSTAQAGSAAMESASAHAATPKPATSGQSKGTGGSAANNDESDRTSDAADNGKTQYVAGSGGANGGVSMLSFDVMTGSLGGFYQPKNVGAIWVENSDGQLVKTLELWATTAARWLTNYNGARAGAAVDVVATPTLLTHRVHHVTWDLTDVSGAAVAPGTYKLFMELTDADATGMVASIDFDTSQGPQMLTPSNEACFSAMTLQLQ